MGVQYSHAGEVPALTTKLQFLRVGDHAGVSARIPSFKGSPLGLDFRWLTCVTPATPRAAPNITSVLTYFL